MRKNLLRGTSRQWPAIFPERNGRRFPVFALGIALVLEVSVFSYFVSHVMGSLHYVKVVAKRSMRIEELRGAIMRLDEVLTMSARMATATATGGRTWEIRYNENAPLLDAAIKEASVLVPDAALDEAVGHTEAANVKLVEMETRSFGLVRAGKRGEARKLLFGPEYHRQKEIYAAGMARFVALLKANLEATQQHEQRRAIISLGVAGAGLVLLLAMWGFVLVSLHRWGQTVMKSVRERELAQEALRQVMAGAQCLLWQAEVQVAEDGLRFQVRIPDEEAARAWLPLSAEGSAPYGEAWAAARGATLEAAIIGAIAGGGLRYSQRFSIADAVGVDRWLFEDVKLELAGPGRWNLIGVCTDITELKVAEAQLEHQAYHDVLTGIPNRQFFIDKLTAALDDGRKSGTACAVLFIDFDNFKTINDSLGHDAGDDFLLQRVSAMLGCIRPNDTLARLGGDEFVALIEGLPQGDPGQALCLAGRMLDEMAKPVRLLDQDVFSGASIGVALSSAEADSISLLRDADTAMYHVKTDGKSGAVLFAASMNDRVIDQMEMESGLRGALSRDELFIQYQPLVDLVSGAIAGTEALVRWNHPTKGLIPPGVFIPVAEETGLIVPIGYWVLEEACRQTVQWHALYPQEVPLRINVNLSGRQIQRADVVERVSEIIQRTGIEPSRLTLEITESVMMKDLDEAVLRLLALKGLGVRLALDDFGTGYSSLANLGSLPLDTIKIDRSFVARLGKHEGSSATIAAIVALAETLHLDITSEGVETESQLAELQSLGCTFGQGFLFDRPLGADTIAEQLRLTASQALRIAA